MQQVSPFLLLKRSTADLLAKHADAALARWADAWAVLPDTAIACMAASGKADALAGISTWHPFTLANGASAWIHVQAGLTRYLEQALFDLTDMDSTVEKHLSSSFTQCIAEEALQDLSHILIGEMTGQASQPAPPSALPNQLIRMGSGAALCTLSLGAKSLWLLLPAESFPAVEEPAKPMNRPPIANLPYALKTTPVTLSVEVSCTELTLGYLKTLAVGDVLALPTSVDHPLRVIGSDGATICHAHLGSLMGIHAVELIKSADQANQG